jgi:phosphoribosylanthranilate isomerase
LQDISNEQKQLNDLRKQFVYGRDGSKCQSFYALPDGCRLKCAKRGIDVIVQIYEIQTPQEAARIAELGADHIGSVLLSEEAWKDSLLKETVETVRHAGRKSSLIPLFGSVETISKAVDFYRPDILHFCETFPADSTDSDALDRLLGRQRDIRERFPELELMRSIPIGIEGRGDLLPSIEMAAAFEPLSDWFLTDTLLGEDDRFTEDTQPVSGFVGITGSTCDWDIAARLVEKSSIPVILAGGIGPQNVEAAVLRVHPAGVDSCTLTNAVDDDGRPVRFVKDPEKVSALVQRAHRAAGRFRRME